MVNLTEIDVQVSLQDSQFFSYTFLLENSLHIEIITSNYNKVILVFDKPIIFVDFGKRQITRVCKGPNDAPIMQRALANHYVQIPEEHPYEFFRLFDNENEISYEVICEKFSVITNLCSCNRVAIELKAQIKDQNNVNDIAQWASTYLVEHANQLSFELREILHCISLMNIYKNLDITKEELLQIAKENYINVDDFGEPRPKPMTKMMIHRAYGSLYSLINGIGFV